MVDLVFNNISSINNIILPAATLITILGMLLLKNTQEKVEAFKPTVWKSILCGVLLVWCIVSFSGVTSFIYVNF